MGVGGCKRPLFKRRAALSRSVIGSDIKPGTSSGGERRFRSDMGPAVIGTSTATGELPPGPVVRLADCWMRCGRRQSYGIGAGVCTQPPCEDENCRKPRLQAAAWHGKRRPVVWYTTLVYCTAASDASHTVCGVVSRHGRGAIDGKFQLTGNPRGNRQPPRWCRPIDTWQPGICP